MSTLSSEYRLLEKQLSALFDGEKNPLTNLSQFAALIFNSLEAINWAGFYLVIDSAKLKLGPFQGQVACTNINFGEGVCGFAAHNRESLLVADVDKFDGHIACDSRSRSELVCPLIIDGTLIGVFDIDSPALNRFKQEDLDGIQALLQVLITSTSWLKTHQFLKKIVNNLNSG